MLTLYLLFGILYAAILGWMYSLWIRPSSPQEGIKAFPNVSLVIPVRNESENLERIFHCVSELNPAPCEVIWIDDHSEDDTFNELQEKIKNLPTSRMLLIKNSGEGKKEAISIAVEKAYGEWIVTTDADCNLPTNWLGKMPFFSNSQDISFFSGPVFIPEAKNFFQAFQQLDWASISLLTNGGVALGKPLMASAANMGFKKNIFEAVDAYSGNVDLLSGDDEFLLKSMFKHLGSKGIVYNRSTMVKTKAHTSWTSLFKQRARWISKWPKHNSLSHGFASLASFLLQVFFLSSIILIFFENLGLLVFIAIWGLKIISEFIVLRAVIKYFRLHVRFLYYPLSSITYPFYVIGTVITMLKGGLHWKGRKIKKMYI